MGDQAAKKPLIAQGWLRVLLFGCCFCVIAILVAVPALLLIAGIKRDDLAANPVGTLSAMLDGDYLWLMVVLEFVISLLSVWIFRTFIDRKSFGSLGFETRGFRGEAAAGFFMGPALLGISCLGLFFSGHLQWTDIHFDPQSLTVSFGLLLLIAFSEELVFRGYILNNLLSSFQNKWIALIISAVLFAAFHITNPGIHFLAIANLLIAGLLFGMNYIYTRNLWFSILFHLSWNFFQGPLLGSDVSGLHMPSLLQLQTTGDLLITGGDFGLEGSIMNMAVSLAAVLILAWAFERKYSPSRSTTGMLKA
ncbi:MAG: CPBP family intramembrane metalloprotease [Bacteroidota bacterium]|nr:CPBP family intramembrane metalloprotease [Bacteroidota bacterium]